MTVPLMVLAAFAVSAGWVGIPEAFRGWAACCPTGLRICRFDAAHYAGEAHHSLVPLFTSLVVALGGLLLGWLVYRGVDKADAVDPMAEPLGPAFVVFKKKYGIDELYQLILIRPAYWLAETFTYKLVDKKILDGILHGIARLGVLVGLVAARL